MHINIKFKIPSFKIIFSLLILFVILSSLIIFWNTENKINIKDKSDLKGFYSLLAKYGINKETKKILWLIAKAEEKKYGYKPFIFVNQISNFANKEEDLLSFQRKELSLSSFLYELELLTGETFILDEENLPFYQDIFFNVNLENVALHDLLTIVLGANDLVYIKIDDSYFITVLDAIDIIDPVEYHKNLVLDAYDRFARFYPDNKRLLVYQAKIIELFDVLKDKKEILIAVLLVLFLFAVMNISFGDSYNLGKAKIETSHYKEIKPFSILSKMNEGKLVNLITKEQPQTIALILSYLDPLKVAKVLRALNSDIQDQVVFKMASIDPVSPEIIAQVESAIAKRL